MVVKKSFGENPIIINFRALYHKFKNLKRKKNMEKFSKLKELIAGVEADADKFYNSGNGAAGTRVRKAMQDLKGLAQEIRTEVTEKKNAK